jgi:hypothetical protein
MSESVDSLAISLADIPDGQLLFRTTAGETLAVSFGFLPAVPEL